MDHLLLKDCTPPQPLSGGDEYNLCVDGFRLNYQHAEAQSREAAADAKMNEAQDSANPEEQFEHLKEAVAERHEIMFAQFSHVQDCFICSVAFGLTPAPKVRPQRRPFAQLLTKLAHVVRPSKLKAGLQRT
ncbi:MAG TPA: hypothetical protein VEV40_02485 [Alloacidobacterium sp.]|nr:hypothetical protein [Alloacidobacterium sp.]